MAVDLLADVKTLLDNNWVSASTGSRTPTINSVFENKRVDFSMGGSKDFIFLYEGNEVDNDAGAGGGAKHKVNPVFIDIRTMFSRNQVLLMRNEIERIIIANEKNPFASNPFFDIADITSFQDLSDKSINLWRFLLTLKLERFNKQ
jgi:hypothetical protein